MYEIGDTVLVTGPFTSKDADADLKRLASCAGIVVYAYAFYIDVHVPAHDVTIMFRPDEITKIAVLAA